MTGPSKDSWEKVLGIKKPPSCNLRAACCSVATFSIPLPEMFQKAAEGDSTCRDMLSCFIPHESHEAARSYYHEQPEHIDRVVKMVRSGKINQAIADQEVHFYHCRYLDNERRCQVYDDRPQFCRDYPASPMALLVKGCGYEPWQAACQTVLKKLGYDVG